MATRETISLRRLVGASDPEIVDRTIPRDSVLVVWQRTGTRWLTGRWLGVWSD